MNEYVNMCMELNVLKDVERKKNLMMFIVNELVPIAALVFVMLFLKGTVRDVSVLLMSLAGFMVRLFEVKLGRFAKYFYVSIIPLFGVVTIYSRSRWKICCHDASLFFDIVAFDWLL